MKTNIKQEILFEIPTDVEQHWKDMPEYNNTEIDGPEITCKFKFRNRTDYEEFKEKVKKYIYNGEKFIDGNQGEKEKQSWYPLIEKSSKYVYEGKKNPRFPVYIVSKGRYENNPTSKTLDNMNVDYRVIVEKNEYDKYKKIIDEKKLLILPEKFKQEYDTFWQDDDKRTGPGPARNFAWQHSIEQGFEYHWVLDDNIESFERFNNNKKVKCASGDPFYVLESFVVRYKNIAISGFAYANFLHWHEYRPPIKFNTRIYSCLLIQNNIPLRWRGRYNEDTDICIRAMKMGLCTVQTNIFLQGKMSTQKLKGGNTKEFYDKEGTKKKSQMLEDMHPDICRITWKFNRWHHHCNYKIFSNNKPKLKSKVFATIKDEMVLKKIKQ
tara:strand:+ start:53 stop:1192 length:1140 start_codon:yes stop_codon:yes gene_type:complete